MKIRQITEADIAAALKELEINFSQSSDEGITQFFTSFEESYLVMIALMGESEENLLIHATSLQTHPVSEFAKAVDAANTYNRERLLGCVCPAVVSDDEDNERVVFHINFALINAQLNSEQLKDFFVWVFSSANNAIKILAEDMANAL